MEHRPDAAVVDIRMPPTMTDDGLRAAVEARAAPCPAWRCCCCRRTWSLSYAEALLADGRGGVGYLLKDRVASLEVLTDALTTIRGAARCSTPTWSPSSSSRDGPTRWSG